jgi:hypothetical protein
MQWLGDWLGTLRTSNVAGSMPASSKKGRGTPPPVVQIFEGQSRHYVGAEIPGLAILDGFCGAAGGTRTPDPLITNAVTFHILHA